MIRKIVIDGNDGTGKSFRIEQMKPLFPGVEFQDRGIFSEATLNDDIFDDSKNKSWESCFVMTPRQKFRHEIMHNSDTLYIILKAKTETCRNRIKERGDSLEEEFHTINDLMKYGQRFDYLVELVKSCPNVMCVCTD